jgi:hypothetical protein
MCTELQEREYVPTYFLVALCQILILGTQARTKDLDQIQLIDLDPKVRLPLLSCSCHHTVC